MVSQHCTFSVPGRSSPWPTSLLGRTSSRGSRASTTLGFQLLTPLMPLLLHRPLTLPRHRRQPHSRPQPRMRHPHHPILLPPLRLSHLRHLNHLPLNHRLILPLMLVLTLLKTIQLTLRLYLCLSSVQDAVAHAPLPIGFAVMLWATATLRSRASTHLAILACSLQLLARLPWACLR